MYRLTDIGGGLDTTYEDVPGLYKTKFGSDITQQDWNTIWGGGEITAPSWSGDNSSSNGSSKSGDNGMAEFDVGGALNTLWQTNAAGPQVQGPGGGDVYKWSGKNVPLQQYSTPTPWAPSNAGGSNVLGGLQTAPQAFGGQAFNAQNFQAPTFGAGLPMSQGVPLASLQQSPTIGNTLQTGMRQGVTNALTGQANLPALQPMLEALGLRQADESQQLAQNLALRGMDQSSIADDARNEMARAQNAEMANLYTQAYSQLVPMQAQVLSQLEAGQRAGRGQQVGELLSALQMQEQLQQGQFGRGATRRQIGAAEQAQQFGQEQALRQQDVSELLQSLELDNQLKQSQFGREAAGYQMGMQNQLNQYAQALQNRQQGLSEYFQFLSAQNTLDQQQATRQAQALSLMLNSLGKTTTVPPLPNFNIPTPQPGAMQALGSIAGNLAPYAFMNM